MLENRKCMQVLLGPRQIGKTTLVKQLMKELPFETVYASADDSFAEGSEWIERNWDLALARMKQTGSSQAVLILDEIQKMDHWSETVKKRWDRDSFEDRALKVILLGSSRMLLQKGLSESMAGRFEVIRMTHWSFGEMHNAFGWTEDQYVYFGAYPGAADLISQENRWKDYLLNLVEASITKDILLLSPIRKPALMKRLFELGCLYSGQLLSYTKILGQLQDAGNTTTLAHYLDLLDTAGLLGGLEKYSGDVIRKKGSSPKFQVHNTGLMTAFEPERFAHLRQQPEKWGRLVESAIGAHLLNHQYSGAYKLYYWREGNEEVDFILERGTTCVALEVKSGKSKHTPATGLKHFREAWNPLKALVIGPDSLSWQDFLSMDPGTLFED